MSSFVVCEITFCKPFFANSAFNLVINYEHASPLCNVNFIVIFQIICSWKRFFAFFTFHWPLFIVQHLNVPLESLFAFHLLPAFFACKWFIATVNYFVSFQVAQFSKIFFTHITWEWFFFRVSFQVFFKIIQRDQKLSTLVARKQLFIILKVLQQKNLICEGVVTEKTRNCIHVWKPLTY